MCGFKKTVWGPMQRSRPAEFAKKGRALYHEDPLKRNAGKGLGPFPAPEPLKKPMPVTIKTPEEQAKMREAGRLAGEILDMIGPHVKPGVTTDELDRICNEYIVGVQKTIPANVGYNGFPKTICSSVNHV